MKSTHSVLLRVCRARVAATLVAAALAGLAHAERADRQKPLNVEADKLEYDDGKRVSVFTGNVTLTKGTIVLQAHRVTVSQDPQGFTRASAFANPSGGQVTFRQRRDLPDQYISGTAQQAEYDGRTETVRLTRQAQLRRTERDRTVDEIHGNVIVYNSITEFFTVESGGTEAATPENPSGRVRMTIQPRATESGSASRPSTP